MPSAQTEQPADLARTAREYDAIPYLSKPFAESHPARLAGAARLFGLNPPAVDTARVLELGGASGGNLIPFAAHHPESRCRVVDIGARQVADGRARAAAIGLDNIAIDCASITDLDASLGQYDYVIAHGVYSWVPAAVREALLKLIGAVLAPDGVAYLSYNVLPGWRMAQPARDAIRALVPDTLPEEARVRAAREVLALAMRRTVNGDTYGQELQRTCAGLLDRSDDFLFHDFMEADNEPFLFSDVMCDADRHGLAFLAEADLCTGFDHNFGEDFVRDVRPRTGGQALPWEALFDVLSGRTFRQTMLVRSDAAPRIDRSMAPGAMHGLHLLMARGAELTATGSQVSASVPHGLRFTYGDAGLATIVRRLLAAGPGSLALDDALRGISLVEQSAMVRTIARWLSAGVLLPLGGAMATAAPGPRPLATRQARADAALGSQRTTNARHESIWLEPEMLLLLPSLDGTRDYTELASLLASGVRDGLIASPEGIAPGDHPALAAAMTEQVPVWIAGLAELGLLAPPSSSPER